MKPSLPLTSVIIPVRNGKEFLEEAIRSVTSQSGVTLEIIIVNDGSTDDDYEKFALLDERIRIVHLSGFGVSYARNVGMTEAAGKYIAFLDADDVWFPGKLSAQIAYMERHPEVGVVFGGFIRWSQDSSGGFPPASSLSKDCSQLTSSDSSRSGWLYTRLLTGLLVGMNTAVVRREVYAAIGGFNESMRQGEDYDFWLKASRVAEMHSLAGEVALYRIHGSSAMHRLSEENHLAALLKSAYMRWGIVSPDGTRLLESAFKKRICSVYFDHGYRHYWHGSLPVARKAFWAALKGGYRPLRSLVYCALCLLPRVAFSKGSTAE
ncbi:MAG: glycosyltransferase family A protein [Methylophilaceae bacterium]|nr:glycosyltransferase family A protein [Methylophilaceae bacterium]